MCVWLLSKIATRGAQFCLQVLKTMYRYLAGWVTSSNSAYIWKSKVESWTQSFSWFHREVHYNRWCNEGVAKLEICLTDIYTWMSQNKLKLNADKTEVLVMGTPQMWAKISILSITVNGVIVPVLNEPVGYLGAAMQAPESPKQCC